MPQYHGEECENLIEDHCFIEKGSLKSTKARMDILSIKLLQMQSIDRIWQFHPICVDQTIGIARQRFLNHIRAFPIGWPLAPWPMLEMSCRSEHKIINSEFSLNNWLGIVPSYPLAISLSMFCCLESSSRLTDQVVPTSVADTDQAGVLWAMQTWVRASEREEVILPQFHKQAPKE